MEYLGGFSINYIIFRNAQILKITFLKEKKIVKENEEYILGKKALKLINYSRHVLKLPIDSGISFSGHFVRQLIN